MYLMYYTDADGKRVYTLEVRDPGPQEMCLHSAASCTTMHQDRCKSGLSRVADHKCMKFSPLFHSSEGHGKQVQGSVARVSWQPGASAAEDGICLKCIYGQCNNLVHFPRTSCLYVQKTAPDGTPTQSAHPARFSPDDKFSRERIILKKRFGLLPTQRPPPQL